MHTTPRAALLGITVSLSLALAGCNSTLFGCDIDSAASSTAGNTSKACGAIDIARSASAAHACAVTEFDAGRAFWVRVQLEDDADGRRQDIAWASDGRAVFFFERSEGLEDENPEMTRTECNTTQSDTLGGVLQLVCRDFGRVEEVCGVKT